MKLNGFTIKPLRNGRYVVVNEDGKICHFDNDINKCVKVISGFNITETKGVNNNDEV